MNGSISVSGNSATFNIASNALNVAGLTGFRSTDEVQWDAFSGSGSDGNTFSSNFFDMTTFENGIAECTYSVRVTGSK